MTLGNLNVSFKVSGIQFKHSLEQLDAFVSLANAALCLSQKSESLKRILVLRDFDYTFKAAFSLRISSL